MLLQEGVTCRRRDISVNWYDMRSVFSFYDYVADFDLELITATFILLVGEGIEGF